MAFCAVLCDSEDYSDREEFSHAKQDYYVLALKANQSRSKGSMKGKRKRAGWSNGYLTKMLRQFALPQL